MDEATQLFIDVLESRRRLAQSVLDAYEANALAGAVEPEDIDYYRTEVAQCDAEIAELLKG